MIREFIEFSYASAWWRAGRSAWDWHRKCRPRLLRLCGAPYSPRSRASGTGSAKPGVAKNHYQTLLKTLEMPGDQARYGDFYNYGYWSGTSYAGHDDLPPGYWVYLAPNWYIYKDAGEGPASAAVAAAVGAGAGNRGSRHLAQVRGRDDRLGVEDAGRPARMAGTHIRCPDPADGGDGV